jgi:hypothetical protein
MQILYFHLLKYNYQNEQKSQWSAFAYLWIFREQRNFWEHEFLSSLHSQENKRERVRVDTQINSLPCQTFDQVLWSWRLSSDQEQVHQP